ncbi:hypothetical protein OBBRIDRAFT_742719, partial [Obba rivulosa]
MRRTRQTHPPPPPAKTGRPETAKEFSKRIHRVVLRATRQGGGSAGETVHLNTEVQPISEQSSHRGPTAPETPVSRTKASANDTHSPTHDLSGLLTSDLLGLISESEEGIDLPKALKGKYREDSFFRNILDNPKHYKNFRVHDGLIYCTDQGKHLLCIPNIRIGGRSARELVIHHAHSILAHLGAYKTTGLLRDHVWWKT